MTAQATKRRNGLIYTELAQMNYRITGQAPPVKDERYKQLMKAVWKYYAPLLIEQETKLLEKG